MQKVGAARRAARDRATRRVAPTIGFARLASGAFYAAIALATSYEIIKIDLPVFKLDAGTEEKFKEINRPAEEVNWNGILNGLSSLPNIYIQTLLIDGNPSNVTGEDLTAYLRHIRALQPQEVHLYSTDRPVPDHGTSRVSRERLEAIALRGQAETGITMRVFSLE